MSKKPKLPMKGELFDEMPEQHATSWAPTRGHAARPGTGPAGETCRSCAHYTIKSMAKDYRKCGLMQRYWTGGAGTDIRASDPACEKWAAK